MELCGRACDKRGGGVSAVVDCTAYDVAVSKAVNPDGDGLACGRIVEFLNRKE